MTLPRPLAADQRTTVSLSRRAVSKASMTSSISSGISQSSSSSSSCATFCSSAFFASSASASPPWLMTNARFRLSSSDLAPRSYLQDTTLGFKNRRPILCVSLHASLRVKVEAFAAGESARSLASAHNLSATSRSSARLPSLNIAASARATPGTMNIFSCSVYSDWPPSASVAHAKNFCSASGMSGRVKSLASRNAARSRTIPGSRRYESWHSAMILSTTGGASCCPPPLAIAAPSSPVLVVT